MQADKGHHALVDIERLNHLGCHATQIEQRETKGRCQEGGLHIQANHHAQPNGGYVGIRCGQQDGRNQWHDHNGNFDKVEEEPEQENHQHHDDKLGPKTARQTGQRMADQLFTAKGTESSGQHGGTDQDHKHHAGGLNGFGHDLIQGVIGFKHAPGTPTDGDKEHDGQANGQNKAKHFARTGEVFDIDRPNTEHQDDADDRKDAEQGRDINVAIAFKNTVTAHQDGAHGTDGAGLVNSCDTAQDGSEHNKNQRQWRH